MDWSSKEVINNPNLSYTSRDYASILEELKAAIPLLTKIYNPQNESDPGIVLIKLMSMLGDMLSYNLDNNALEVFPKTVLQHKNAQQLFRLIGYKMRWYVSARCMAYFTNANSIPVSIGRYNTFTSYTGIVYTNLNQIEIPGGTTGSNQVYAELVQGKPVTPAVNNNSSLAYSVGEWHDVYGYNIEVSSQVIDNRIYFTSPSVDGTTVVLIDDDDTAFVNNTWERVENLNTVTDIGKYFEFDFDESGSPFIQLPDYWNTRYAITRFKLFYVVSDGEAGEIIDNSLSTIGTEKVYVTGSTSVASFMDLIKIYNQASTFGYSPETPEEARKSAELYVNTIDTLVVLDDFAKATKRITGVANALATDIETDPDAENMLSNQIKIYVIRKPGYNLGYDYGQYGSSDYYMISDELNDDVWKTTVADELRDYKIAKQDLQIFLENAVDWIEWTVEGSIWLRQPVPSDKNHDIMVSINDNLDYTFSPSNLNFNEAVNTIDVVDNIKSSDKLIYHVDLSTADIQYSRIRRDTNGNPTGLTVNRKWKLYQEVDGGSSFDTHYYVNGFGCAPTVGGDGSQSGTGYKLIRERGYESNNALSELDENLNVDELEIYNNYIYNWVQENRIDTGYYIQEEPEGKDNKELTYPRIENHNVSSNESNYTPYHFVEYLEILLSDGLPSGEYFVRNVRDSKGLCAEDVGYDESSARPVYDILDGEDADEWTNRFVDRNTGEIFMLRGNVVYSTKRYYKESSMEIVDGFGEPLYDASGKIIMDPVAKSELTGRYEQTLELNPAELVTENGEQVSRRSSEYKFYLGQDKNGNPLTDSLGNTIVAFPIKPDGFHVYIDTDKYILHDTGTGIITGSQGALNGPGYINYATGEIYFNLAIEPQTNMKIVYYKNTVAMARYNQFDTEKFYTQPQFLRYSDANRTLG